MEQLPVPDKEAEAGSVSERRDVAIFGKLNVTALFLNVSSR